MLCFQSAAFEVLMFVLVAGCVAHAWVCYLAEWGNGEAVTLKGWLFTLQGEIAWVFVLREAGWGSSVFGVKATLLEHLSNGWCICTRSAGHPSLLPLTHTGLSLKGGSVKCKLTWCVEIICVFFSLLSWEFSSHLGSIFLLLSLKTLEEKKKLFGEQKDTDTFANRAFCHRRMWGIWMHKPYNLKLHSNTSNLSCRWKLHHTLPDFLGAAFLYHADPGAPAKWGRALTKR